MELPKSDVPNELPLKPFYTPEIDLDANAGQWELQKNLHTAIFHMRMEFGITACDVAGSLRMIIKGGTVVASPPQNKLIGALEDVIRDVQKQHGLTTIDICGVCEGVIFDIMSPQYEEE